jgi:hypothetical protein
LSSSMGNIVQSLLPVLFTAAETHGFDVALVTNERTAFIAAQTERYVPCA